MKKITLLFAFFTVASNAQSFPTPYCEISDSDEVSVEEISTVSFNDVAINNTNFADALVDFTATLVPVIPGQAYSLKVYGNTYGDFDTSIVAFIYIESPHESIPSLKVTTPCYALYVISRQAVYEYSE